MTEEAQFEDVIRILLAAEGNLPPASVINSGVSGEFIRRLLDSGRYDRAVAKLPGLDYILIRYGGNDHSKRKDFAVNFPKDNRLDAHFGNLEGWFGDRHSKLAGYRVIADETAKFLAPIMRERSRK